jgi:hypothetical protein
MLPQPQLPPNPLSHNKLIDPNQLRRLAFGSLLHRAQRRDRSLQNRPPRLVVLEGDHFVQNGAVDIIAQLAETFGLDDAELGERDVQHALLPDFGAEAFVFAVFVFVFVWVAVVPRPQFHDIQLVHGHGRFLGIPGPAAQDAPEGRQAALGEEGLAEVGADEAFAGEIGRVAPGIRVVGGVDAADGVGEVHVDFEEEVGEAHEGGVGEVGFGADDEGALVVGGEVEEEPEVLRGRGLLVWIGWIGDGLWEFGELTFRASSVPAGQRWP